MARDDIVDAVMTIAKQIAAHSPLAVTEGGMRGGAFVATDHYTHYSLLSMINSALGLPNLSNNDLFANPMNEFWV